MVTLKLGPLGCWELIRAAQSNDVEAEDAVKTPASDAPPPYAASSSRSASPTTTARRWLSFPRRGTTQGTSDAPLAVQRAQQLGRTASSQRPAFAPPPRTDNEQLRMYLLEILAFTLGANIDALTAALHHRAPVNEGTTSLLTAPEHAHLLCLAQTVQHLQQKTVRNELNTMAPPCMTEALHKILCPAQELASDTFEAYALDLIASYNDHQCDPHKWLHTLVGYWKRNPVLICGAPLAEWKYTLSTHAYLIAAIAPTQRVQQVLGNALERYQEEQKVTGFKYVCYYWPRREGYADLAMLLKERERRGWYGVDSVDDGKRGMELPVNLVGFS
ncbi:hypothetical protein EJ02DRAFT_458677 [Clathrospora elynae]|uniref:Uncharacterized protein n=1 Tax=Clathrospora elynae TaxID=706981 RepID=A0A6A5SJG6_9PLEO|nr:hypothetical protein EJ02DRAFT_458677 [Clathrospora elynae]